MAYTTAEGRKELIETIAAAASELAFASTALGEAYELLDEQSADRLEEECFRPVQVAFGRAKRTSSEFAARHGLDAPRVGDAPPGLPSQGAAGFIDGARAAVGAADHGLAELQDGMLPVEVGDEQLRAGIVSIREPLDGFDGKAAAFLRGLGR